MSRFLKRITILMIVSLMLVVNYFAPSSTTLVKANDLPFSNETMEWLEWFNSLPYEDQIAINYRPYELTQYLNQGNELFEELFELVEVDLPNIEPNELVPSDPGAGGMVTGGYELSYNPNYWNDSTRIKKANCYYYAMNALSNSTSLSTQQPGYKAGVTFSLNGSSIISAVKKDIPYLSNPVSIRASSQSEKPGVKEYKVALVIDPGKDYHWYRQNSDGTWSHKRGQTNVVKTDASGYIIYNPKTCNRNYGTYNYSTFVGFYIVKYK